MPGFSETRSSVRIRRVTVLKGSEDGDDIILRLNEYAGEADSVTIRIDPLARTYNFLLARHEIKTIRLIHDRDWEAVEVNMLEDTEGD